MNERKDIEVKPSGRLVPHLKPLPPGSPPLVDKPNEPSKTDVETTPFAGKTVTFKYTEKHQWDVSVTLDDPKMPFTERDWNLIERLLTVKRVLLRREASLAYIAANRAKVENEAKSILTADKLPSPATV